MAREAKVRRSRSESGDPDPRLKKPRAPKPNRDRGVPEAEAKPAVTLCIPSHGFDGCHSIDTIDSIEPPIRHATNATRAIVSPQNPGWRLPVAPKTVQARGQNPTPSTTRSVARPKVPRKYIREGDDDDHHKDEQGGSDPHCSRLEANTLLVSDIPAVIKFYHTRFKELTMKPLRQIVTAWVKRLEPSRNRDYGPYDKTVTPATAKSGTCPPWWPKNTPYTEPSHLKSNHLIPLAIEIMMVHRDVDEKKRTQSWMENLEKDAIYHIDTTPDDSFSSSKEAAYHKCMKERATQIITNLFSIAKSHEAYILTEGCGSDNKVTWYYVPKPQRLTNRKRKRAQSMQDATRSDTEPDDVTSYTQSFRSMDSNYNTREVSPEQDFIPPKAVDSVYPGMCHTSFAGALPSYYTPPVNYLPSANNADDHCKNIIPAGTTEFPSVNNIYPTNSYVYQPSDPAFVGGVPYYFDPNTGMYSWNLDMYTAPSTQPFPGVQALPLSGQRDKYDLTGYPHGL
ncbi:unnamed protein product [Periconia digitata]|uniref:Subtelomeric hrmA-associated cluster protein AFUB-079030/YDR124W-like helical bundle domain-containing protein n=1 Tax=Periconia digitata TaxID=1303443 RepID=A0A9W4UBZ6_9PLEO|nr:unnamed protein product [Periconia digitata]